MSQLVNSPIRLVDTVCNSANRKSYWAVLEQNFPVVLPVYHAMLYKIVLTFETVCGWNPKVWLFKWKLLNRTFQWYCWFTMQYKVVLTFESVDKILKWVRLFKWKLLGPKPSSRTACLPCRWNPKVWLFKWKLLSNAFLRYRLVCCTRLLILSLWMKH